MRAVVFFFLFVLLMGAAAPALAYDNTTNYNYKHAPPDQQRGEDGTVKEQAKSDADEDADQPQGDLAPPKQELSTPQKEEIERHKATGEGSDVFHGDENSWPHHGNLH